MFTINERPFITEECILDAYFDEDELAIKWGLRIKAYSNNETLSKWKPMINIESLFSTKPKAIESLIDLAGRSLAWTEEVNEDGSLFGTIYLFEHYPISNCNINFYEKDGLLYIRIVAISHLKIDKHFSKIIIDERLTFIGIWCGRKNEIACSQLVKIFFNDNHFTYTKTDHDVSLLKPHNF